MEKYGFFGGSFNPVTKAHVELAQDIVNKYNLDKVIFVPVGDFYKKKNLISEKDRYKMLQIATKTHTKLEVSNIELNETKELTTLQALKKIESKYQNSINYYIMGADNIYKMLNSEDLEELAQNYKYIIIKRNQIDCDELIKSNNTLLNNKKNIHIIENDNHKSTNATEVRNKIENCDYNVEHILSKEILEYIQKNNLYK